MQNKSVKTKASDRALAVYVAVLLALGPLFDPYVLFVIKGFATIKVLDLPMMLAATLVFVRVIKTRQLPGYPQVLVLVVLFAMLTAISFTSTTENRSLMNAVKNTMANLALAMAITFLLSCWDKCVFISIVQKVALISTIFLLYQYFSLSKGVTDVFDGKIPFLELGKYDGWSKLIDGNTGDIRAHSFFQEPSYYALYILPFFAWSLMNKRYLFAVFSLLGLVLSSSLLSILVGFIVMCYVLFDSVVQSKMSFIQIFRISFMLVSSLMLIGVLIYLVSPAARNTIDYYVFRIKRLTMDLQSERMGSTRFRLLGFLPRFSEYPMFLKVFGVGNNQFSNYLSVTPYSSLAVSTLLNYGVIGFLLFVGFFISLYKTIPRNNRVYLLLLVILCLTDYQWLNWYFIYMLSWCLPSLTCHISNNEIVSTWGQKGRLARGLCMIRGKDTRGNTHGS